MQRLTVQYFDPTDTAAFVAAYRERHVPIVRSIPGLERFTLSTPRGGDGTPALVAELWFADAEAMQAGLASPAMAEAAADAETHDVARRTMFSGPVEDA